MQRQTRTLLGTAATAVVLVGGLVAYCATRDTSVYEAHVFGYQVVGDGHQLTLFVETAPCDKIIDVHVDEKASSVSVVVNARQIQSDAPECNTLLGVTQDVTVQLKGPMGDRTLIDIAGDPVPRLSH